MDKSKNLRVSDACWELVKLAAVKERVTMREWVECAVHQYVKYVNRPITLGEQVSVDFTVDAAAPASIVTSRPSASEKHWTPDD